MKDNRMSTEIITTYDDREYRSTDIWLDFDKESEYVIYLDLRAEGKNINDDTYIFWEIYSNGTQVDLGDLTRGVKAELRICRSYAGSREKPHVFDIVLKDKNRQEIALQRLKIYAKTRIYDGKWVDKKENGIKKAKLNTNVYIEFKAVGIYGVPLTLTIFRLDQNGDEMLFTREIEMENLHETESFYLSERWFKKGGVMSEILSRLFSVTTAELYFMITENEKLLYNGKTSGEILHVDRSIVEIPQSPVISLSPVVVSKEEYFTQSYEPCKYEKIHYRYGDDSGEIFDEKKPYSKPYPKHELKVISGNDSAKKKLEIFLTKVSTDECAYTEENKRFTVYRDEEHRKKAEGEKPHKGRVFQTKILEENGIVEYEKTDEKLSFVPIYPYLENEYLSFLRQFLFSDPLKIALPIETCRYRKKLHLTIYPDVLWTYHGKYGYDGDYFYKEEALPLVRGIKETWEEVRPYVELLATIIPQLHATKWIIDYLAEEAESISLGFHARYNEKSEILDYTSNYRRTTQFVIFQMVALQLVLEIIFIILSEGALLEAKSAKYLQKTQKAAKRIKRFEKALDGMDMEIITPSVAMNSACYYEKQNDGKIALVVEHNVKADPLLAIKYEKELTLGDLLKRRQENRKAKGKTGEDKLAWVVDKVGAEAKLTVKVQGKIAGECNVKMNTLTGKLEILPLIGNYIIHNQMTVTQTQAISVHLEIDSEMGIEIAKFESNLKLKAKANGAVSHSRSYGKDETGIWIQDIINLSEITGTYMVKTSLRIGNHKAYDSNPDETPVPFVAMDAREIPLPKIYLVKL